MELKDYLLLLARHDGSDIYLSTGAPPCAKFQGVLRALDKDPLAPGRVKEIAYSVMDAAQIAEFEAHAGDESGDWRNRRRSVPGQYLQAARRSVDGDSQHQEPIFLPSLIWGCRRC
jgi:Tfp pilus assembly pilus retraction ATPase PilT